MNEPVCIIRQSYLIICNGNACAAAVLNFLEFYAVNYGMLEKPQYHTAKSISDSLLKIYGEKTIREAVRFLEKELNFIEITKNPDSRFGYDKTNHYLLKINEINKAIALTVKLPLEEVKKPLVNGKITVCAENYTENSVDNSTQTVKLPPDKQQNCGSQTVILPLTNSKITASLIDNTNRESLIDKSDKSNQSFSSEKDAPQKNENLDYAKNANCSDSEIPTCKESLQVENEVTVLETFENENSANGTKDKKNTKKNRAPAARKSEAVKETNTHHHAIIAAYTAWYEQTFTGAKAPFEGADIIAPVKLTKKLRDSIISLYKSKNIDAVSEVVESKIIPYWNNMLANYESWDSFYPTFKKGEQPVQERKYRKSTRLYEIARDFDKIILNWLKAEKVIKITEKDTRSEAEKKYDVAMELHNR